MRCSLFQLARHFTVPDFVRVQVYKSKTGPVFHLTLAQLVQIGLPNPIILQVLRNVARKQDVSRISTIHHPLCDVDAGSGNIRLIIHVSDSADRTAMQPHADAAERISPKPFCQFHRTLSRSFRGCKKG